MRAIRSRRLETSVPNEMEREGSPQEVSGHFNHVAEVYATFVIGENISEEDYNIKEIDEGILFEFDTAGDFNVEKIDLSKGDRVAYTESALLSEVMKIETDVELPVLEARSMENIYSTFKQLHEGVDIEEVILPNIIKNQQDHADTHPKLTVVEEKSLEDIHTAFQLSSDLRNGPSEIEQNDAVSAKEIEFSNAVSGIQENRENAVSEPKNEYEEASEKSSLNLEELSLEIQKSILFTLGKTRKMQKKETIEVTEQATEVNEETLPSWWVEHKAELEGRIQTLEDGMIENRGYLQRILQLANQAAEEKDSPQSARIQPSAAEKQNKAAKPVEFSSPLPLIQKCKKKILWAVLSARIQPSAAEKQNKGKGKKPCLVTILSEHEKYTFKPNELGILAAKPVEFSSPLPFNSKVQEENIMGSASEFKVDNKGLFGSSGPMLPQPKLDLQMFDGSNPRGWVRKCQKYFNLVGVPEEQKLDVAAMYLMGKAETWFDGYIIQKHRVTWHEFEADRVTWHEFEADLCHRFCDRNYSDIIEEFNKLMQKGEDYFVSSFISGLKEELKHKVKVLEPKNLSEAYRQAKLYRLANEIEGKKYKSPSRIFSYTPSNSQQNSGHQCKVRQLNCMEEEEPTDSTEQDLTEEENREVPYQAKEALELSINAITGNMRYTTLRIQANGEKLFSTARSNKVSWKMQGYDFQHDFRVLSLGEFKEVFEEPKGMPPSRKHDHAIVLKQGTQPVNLRAYRFAHHHKTEVEKHRLLKCCPHLLFRALNSAIVKNKFPIPIPIVDDLLDELNEVVFFLKIDLRSGYWQIRIKEEDIHKTTFRTHQGNYEFKVMPFGLTNAPATFQALMNDLYGAYLRKFVLVFFDDILIYSPSLAEHKQHLRTVLEVLLKSRLYAKKNPNKVKAMQQWPLPKNLKALRGFLGLTGYYRKFIRGYGELKTEASSKGIGAVLSQAGRPIAYLSKALGPKHADLSIYEKYRKGKSNKAADALSRQQLDSGEFIQIGVTVITPTWVQDIEKRLLQPIAVPNNAWEVITMDFIEVVEVARVYLEQVYKLHGPPKAEWWYNTNYNSALQMTPFEALYGYKAPNVTWTTDSRVEAVYNVMQNREQEFQIGDEVYLKLQPYRQTSLALRRNLKLAARYFGPYKIKDIIGLISINPPEVASDGQLKIYPALVLDQRVITRQNRAVIQLLIQWTNMGATEATWEDYTVLRQQFPQFDPWGKESSGEEGIVMMIGKLGFDRVDLGEMMKRRIGKQHQKLGKDQRNLGIDMGARD
ncbi:hypothetical protein F3Y22_tig00111807pilonHSYRG00050 [Hibiscus syriacus]|uniref:Reverse transcriptase domain-containing protein n=1 Tax=Hibiscus syriacus TaxID=106335 RepID=A0A6A2Y012_HIBSY|nr:hypothetical protein F3Y22_tig00111807pilonHSYRG00050 [Hibiscus syriacus]